MQDRTPTVGTALPRFEGIEGLFPYLANICESMGSSVCVLMHALYNGRRPRVTDKRIVGTRCERQSEERCMLGQGQLCRAIRLGTTHLGPRSITQRCHRQSIKPRFTRSFKRRDFETIPQAIHAQFHPGNVACVLGISRPEQERRYKTSLYPPGLFEG